MANKHGDIARELRAEIAAGQYDATGRLPSEAQLVERFSVSPAFALTKTSAIIRDRSAGVVLSKIRCDVDLP